MQPQHSPALSVLFKGFISFLLLLLARVDVTLSSVSCFTLWDILSSLGLNNACGKNSENVPLRNENNVARSFSDHFPGHYSVEREEA